MSSISFELPRPANFKRLEDVSLYLDEVAREVERAFNSQKKFLELVAVTDEPARLYDGLTVYAPSDVGGWNPGSGEGVYTYYGAAWHKLG